MLDSDDTVPVRRFFHALRSQASGRQDTHCARPNREYRHQRYESQDNDESDEHKYCSVFSLFLAPNPCPIQILFISLVSDFADPEADPAAKRRSRIGWKLGAQAYTFFPRETLESALGCMIVSQLSTTVFSGSLTAAGQIRVSSSRQAKTVSADCI